MKEIYTFVSPARWFFAKNFHGKFIRLALTVTLLISTDSWGQSSRIWATYYGGPGNENGSITGTATDAFGNVFLCGTTASSSGIASGGFQNTLIGTLGNAYLIKFDAAGNRLWGTYYGNTGGEYGTSVATDAAGNVYLSGTTASTTGIASGGHDNIFGGGSSDAFLVKFDANGNRLWATYYGGAGDEGSGIIKTDASNNVYLCGPTTSTTSISSGGHQNTFGGVEDAFLVKFNSAGVRLWATYYGGTGIEQGYGVAVNPSGDVFLIGNTTSTTAISSGGFQNTFGGGANDAFLVKFNTNGIRQWATYYGDVNMDLATSVTCDASGNVFLGGYTASTANIASGGFQNTFGGGTSDNYLVKFTGAGLRSWATYYGGSGDEFSSNYQALVTDAGNNIYLGGTTNSTNAISFNGFQNSFAGGSDAYLVEFDNNGNRIVATYYGDVSNESGYAISIDNSGKVYQCGLTMSTSNIASGGFQNTHAGGVYDAFLVKFDACSGTPSQPGAISGPTTVCNGATNTYSITPVSGATSYTWTLPSGWTGTSTTNSINATAGATGGNITVTANNTCGSSSAETLAVSVNDVSPTGMLTFGNFCFGQCVATATGSFAGTGPFTYSWSDGQTTQTASNLCAGTYTVTATGAGGCSASIVATITTPTAVTATTSATPASFCVGGCSNLTAMPNGGTPGYSFSWSPATGLSSTSIFNPVACPAITTTYTCTVSDANNCTGTATVTVTVNALPTVSMSATSTTTCINWTTDLLTGTPGGGVFSGTAVTGNNFDPSAAGQGSFYVVYNYTDVNGCTNADSVLINVGLCTDVPAKDNMQLTIYPNPFNEILVVNMTVKGEMKMYSVIGEEIGIWVLGVGRNEIALSNLPEGVYFVQIQTPEGMVSEKMIRR